MDLEGLRALVVLCYSDRFLINDFKPDPDRHIWMKTLKDAIITLFIDIINVPMRCSHFIILLLLEHFIGIRVHFPLKILCNIIVMFRFYGYIMKIVTT